MCPLGVGRPTTVVYLKKEVKKMRNNNEMFKVTSDEDDVFIRANHCDGQPLIDVLRHAKIKLLENKTDGCKKTPVVFIFEVIDIDSIISEKEWEAMKEAKDYMYYSIFIADDEEGVCEVYLRKNEDDDKYPVDSMAIAYEYWDSLISTVENYGLITSKQAKELYLK
jgi:hypothetical protein